MRVLFRLPLTASLLLVSASCGRSVEHAETPAKPEAKPEAKLEALYEPSAWALGGFASIPWRAAVGRIDDWDDDIDLVVAAGGDLYPQNLFAVGGCAPASSAPPFRGLDDLRKENPTKENPTRHRGRIWVSPLYAFYTQVGIADVLADPGNEVVAGFRGTALPFVDGTNPTGGILAMSLPDLDNEKRCTLAGETSGHASTSELLLCGAKVNDFVMTDVDNDGDHDIVAALAAWDPEAQSCKAGRIDVSSKKRVEPPLPVDPDALLLAPPIPVGEKSCPDPEAAPDGRRIEWRPLANERSDRFIGVFINDGQAKFTPLGGLYPVPEWIESKHPAEPSRVFVTDVNGDGYVDIIGAFQASSIVVATGPFVAQERDAECTGELRVDGPGRIGCVATERFVSDLDVAIVAAESGDASSRQAVVVGATSCMDGHTWSGCCGAGRLVAWWPTSGTRRVLHETSGREVIVSAVSLVQFGSEEQHPSVVFGLAADPRQHCSAFPLQRVGLDPVAEPVAPLSVEDPRAPRLPADIVAVRGGISSDHEAPVRSMPGPRIRVTIPGTGPVDPIAVSWGGTQHTQCRVDTGTTDDCWSWDEAARGVVLPAAAAGDGKVEYRSWRQPLVIAVDSNAMQGLRFYSARK